MGNHAVLMETIIPRTDELKALVKEVRSVRAKTNICPSAQPNVGVPEMLNFLTIFA